MIGFSPRDAHTDTSYYQHTLFHQGHTFFDSRDNSESNNDRHDGLYNTWNVSGVFVVNTILSMGLKSRFISFRDRIIGLTGEFPIF
jgi:hypothetical protein